MTTPGVLTQALLIGGPNALALVDDPSVFGDPGELAELSSALLLLESNLHVERGDLSKEDDDRFTESLEFIDSLAEKFRRLKTGTSTPLGTREDVRGLVATLQATDPTKVSSAIAATRRTMSLFANSGEAMSHARAILRKDAEGTESEPGLIIINQKTIGYATTAGDAIRLIMDYTARPNFDPVCSMNNYPVKLDVRLQNGVRIWIDLNPFGGEVPGRRNQLMASIHLEPNDLPSAILPLALRQFDQFRLEAYRQLTAVNGKNREKLDAYTRAAGFTLELEPRVEKGVEGEGVLRLHGRKDTGGVLELSTSPRADEMKNSIYVEDEWFYYWLAFFLETHSEVFTLPWVFQSKLASPVLLEPISIQVEGQANGITATTEDEAIEWIIAQALNATDETVDFKLGNHVEIEITKLGWPLGVKIHLKGLDPKTAPFVEPRFYALLRRAFDQFRQNDDPYAKELAALVAEQGGIVERSRYQGDLTLGRMVEGPFHFQLGVGWNTRRNESSSFLSVGRHPQKPKPDYQRWLKLLLNSHREIFRFQPTLE